MSRWWGARTWAASPGDGLRASGSVRVLRGGAGDPPDAHPPRRLRRGTRGRAAHPVSGPGRRRPGARGGCRRRADRVFRGERRGVEGRVPLSKRRGARARREDEGGIGTLCEGRTFSGLLLHPRGLERPP
ncbi:MAG: hypothetical protein EXR71_19675 [Myxococcales bacterium]|nr:hypothetical protein [Myxococcales bacterium]